MTTEHTTKWRCGRCGAIDVVFGIVDNNCADSFRLAVAAPDLLEACDKADTAFAVINISRDEPLSPQASGALREAWAGVNAAMSKATGKPNRFLEANPKATA